VRITVLWPAGQHTVWTEQSAVGLIGQQVRVTWGNGGAPGRVTDTEITDTGDLKVTLDVDGDVPGIGQGGINFHLLADES
jgi:hypothetical protein